MHKLILFDWGNMLLNSDSNDYSISDARIAIATELSHKDPVALHGIFKDPDFAVKSGDALDSLIADYLNKAGCSCTIEDFKTCYLKHFRKVPWFNEIVALVNTLASSNNVRVGILSTLCEMDLQLIKEKMENIDYFFLSFNLGVQKPDTRIYETVETVTGFSKNDILYFDDCIPNIMPATSKGWRAIPATGNDFQKILRECMVFTGIEIELPKNDTLCDHVTDNDSPKTRQIYMAIADVGTNKKPKKAESLFFEQLFTDAPKVMEPINVPDITDVEWDGKELCIHYKNGTKERIINEKITKESVTSVCLKGMEFFKYPITDKKSVQLICCSMGPIKMDFLCKVDSKIEVLSFHIRRS